MILSVTFSKPVKNISEILGNDFVRVKIKLTASSVAKSENYFAEFYTEKQVFHKKFSQLELDDFIKTHGGTTFKNVVERTESEEITLMASRKGKITRLVKNISALGAVTAPQGVVGHLQNRGEDSSGLNNVDAAVRGGTAYFGNNGAEPQGVVGHLQNRGEDSSGLNNVSAAVRGDIAFLDNNGAKAEPCKTLPERSEGNAQNQNLKNIKFLQGGQNRRKNYLLEEGVPVPFLVRLGLMTAEGKVINSKYDKFRQINRFLEFVDDILTEIKPENDEKPLSIVDFGSGKSYLTFAVQYFLTEIRKIPCEIFGLDLKKDVIDYCSRLALELGLENLKFAVGNIADYGEEKNPDIVITLHACDTATDFALNYAVRHNARAILSVPCCQHEINSALTAKKAAGTDFEIFTRYGLIEGKIQRAFDRRNPWRLARKMRIQSPDAGIYR
ncbi:MAG: SAM-dependent methyltransferase [Treponema sp.]|nr:SAM-dependent methyltransferase [Treponema sp.]